MGPHIWGPIGPYIWCYFGLIFPLWAALFSQRCNQGRCIPGASSPRFLNCSKMKRRSVGVVHGCRRNHYKACPQTRPPLLLTAAYKGKIGQGIGPKTGKPKNGHTLVFFTFFHKNRLGIPPLGRSKAKHKVSVGCNPTEMVSQEALYFTKDGT